MSNSEQFIFEKRKRFLKSYNYLNVENSQLFYVVVGWEGGVCVKTLALILTQKFRLSSNGFRLRGARNLNFKDQNTVLPHQGFKREHLLRRYSFS
jgi:hypothetical protein